jgi:hypothetical protein
VLKASKHEAGPEKSLPIFLNCIVFMLVAFAEFGKICPVGIGTERKIVAKVVYRREAIRVGAGDSNHRARTSAPVKDGVGEVGVYVRSFWATHSARHSQ